MTTTSIVIVVVAAVVIAALVIGAVVANRQRQRRRLQEQFGPEYDRAVSTVGGQKQAELDLRNRLEQRDKLAIQPLGEAERDRYGQEWRQVQAAFVDEPNAAVGQADALITTVMMVRGYPMRDFDAKADLVSVDHPQVVENYREAHEIFLSSRSGVASTEDLRQAFVSYRALFAELVESSQDGRAPASVNQTTGPSAANSAR